MPRTMFVHLPVADLAASVRFFLGLGLSFDERVDDEQAACLVVSDRAAVMLLARPLFATFTRKAVADAGLGTEAILSLSATSRAEVDALVDSALHQGGSVANAPSDRDGVYGRSFFDLDGHAWEVLWMGP